MENNVGIPHNSFREQLARARNFPVQKIHFGVHRNLLECSSGISESPERPSSIPGTQSTVFGTQKRQTTHRRYFFTLLNFVFTGNLLPLDRSFFPTPRTDLIRRPESQESTDAPGRTDEWSDRRARNRTRARTRTSYAARHL